MKTIYEADDGTKFETAEACREHEEAHEFDALVGLDSKQVADALARTNVVLADLFEKAGSRISKVRREAGELRRAPNGEKAAEPPVTPTEGSKRNVRAGAANGGATS